MSYINEALKKAQRDRDSRRIRRMGLWKNIQKGNKTSKKILLYILLSALAIGLGFMVYLWFDMAPEQQPSHLGNALHDERVKNTASTNGRLDLSNKPVRKKVNQTPPMSERVVPNTARLYDRAMDLYRKGRLQDAEKLYKDLLRLDPTFTVCCQEISSKRSTKLVKLWH